ncbi:MAG: recombinase family protein [Mycobacteriales bacterium]
MPTRAAAYCRISDDRRGESLGVERQRQDCAALAAGRGWDVTATFTDNDVSAYSGRVRPAYVQLLDGLRAGLFDAVVAWHPDRLHRSPTELEEFISTVEAHRVKVETVQAGQWDLSSPSGRLVARQLGSVARYESEHKAERVRSALEQRAQMGRPHGRRPYGWTRVGGGEVVNPTEADVVVGIADRIIAGDSLRQITADLNAAGIPSPTGKPWGKNMVRHVVSRERNAGLRVHRGAVIGAGDWPPILDRSRWEQVRAVLTDPRRKTSTSSTAVHLLSGIARCGVCGGSIRAGLNRAVPSYRCADHSCVSRNRADVDELVTRVVLERLARPDAAALLTPDRSGEVATARKEVAGLRARLDLAADAYADGDIDAQQLQRITAKLRPQLDAAEARGRAVDDAPLLTGLLGVDDVRAVWERLALTRRRAVVDLLLTVTIQRAAQGARSFDPTAVQIEWRTG